MAKDLKIKIKNKQLAKAVGLDKLRAKLSGETAEEKKEEVPLKKKEAEASETTEEQSSKKPRIRAKSKSDFALAEEETEKEVPLSIEEEPVPVVEEQIEALPPSIEEELEKPMAKEKSSTSQLGPTGRHIKDLLPSKKVKKPPLTKPMEKEKKIEPVAIPPKQVPERDFDKEKKKVREFKDFKTLKRPGRGFDSHAKSGLTEGENERWRKKRPSKQAKQILEEQVTRPTILKIRLPISVKDLAAAMKYKASEIIAKLLMQGMPLTLNDMLDDETTVQLLGHEFGCEITIDTSLAERIRITDKTISEEIAESNSGDLVIRPPVVTFMGHVDHGKTSLIDKIRESNITSGEAGAITQHMGAFKCRTKVGEITILDTPGHEAFSAMRARGADVTDIVVLVVAGDEGMREQTLEAIQHAKAANVTIVCAINKCDKPNFNAENVYRELSENNLLPEVWGGQTLTINTSATTGEGIPELLEMLALQAEVLELKANPKVRARGVVLESELHKGLGSIATLLVQNGSLHFGDAIVFDQLWGRVKTMHDEYVKDLKVAGPSTPVEITGLSGLPHAGDPFIVVRSEKEAKEIAEARAAGIKKSRLLQKRRTLEFLQTEKGQIEKKILKLIIRADVQGSLEAMKHTLMKIESEKAEVEIIFTGIGEISESDIQLAAASKAVIFGFHTKVEAHAESLIKELGVTIRLFNVIYHAIDETKAIMQGLLEKLEEEKEMGKAEVQQIFKSSHLGVIAGCLVTDGVIHRNHRMRVIRSGEVIWKGAIASIKRLKEDVKEVKKGLECGILLDGFNSCQAGDLLEAYEIVLITQEL
ncbi:MAG: translation initiation factor IF-2 [Chlamydiia bacterium]|nr:translation initiation factor IF-2 [Chlamydiia bacterium]